MRVVFLAVAALTLCIALGPEQNASAAVPPYAWMISRADTDNNTGLSTSLALDGNGDPYISYLEQTNGVIRVAHRTVGVWSTEVVAYVGNARTDTSIAIAPNGTLYVSFVGGDPRMVEFAVRSSFGWNVAPVDAGYSDGYARLAIDPSGRPVIAYAGANGWLQFASWNGTAWTREVVDRITVIARYISVAIDSTGGPHISYYGDGVVRYATKEVGAWHTEIVDVSPYAGWFTRLGLDSRDVPHVAYYDSVNYSLRYAERVNGTWSTSTIDDRDDAGWDLSLVVDHLDRVHIAYYARIRGELRYAIRTAGGWIREVVDADGVVGWDTGIAADRSGLPRISYYDWTNGDLKYAEGAIALAVRTLRPSRTTADATTLEGEVVSLGDYSSAETRFAVRPAGSTEWNYSAGVTTTQASRFSTTIGNLTLGQRYEYRAEARTGNETVFGEILAFTIPIPVEPEPPYLLVIAGATAGAVASIVVAWLLIIVRRRRR